MSSWIPSLFDPDSDYDNPISPTSSSPSGTPRVSASGVKDDLSAVFRGVAAFLAPREGSSSSAVSYSSSDAIAGIKNDLAEIQGRTLSTRPELWIDFPLSLADDFDMSDYQRDHAANIDYLVPELVTLRQQISSQISEGKFWIIYFILLFPRLREEDLKLLSAPQVVEARETLLKKLQNKSNTMQETSENHSRNPETNHDIDKRRILEGDVSDKQHKSTSSEIVTANKPMDNMASEHNISEEERGPCTSVDARKQSENEDISFSDLEDDDHDHDLDLSEKILEFRLLNNEKGEASEWAQLNENSGGQGGKKKAGQSALRDKESESEDSNDWLAVDDNDFDNLGGNLNL